MDKDAIKTVDQWIWEIVGELEKKWLDEVGEVLTWHEVGVFVNDEFEASIIQGYVEPNNFDFDWLRDCGLTDTEDEFVARLDAYDERFKGCGGRAAYSISDGTIDWEWIEDDYEERLANKPARIVRDLTWTQDYNSFSDHEDTGDIYLELVEED